VVGASVGWAERGARARRPAGRIDHSRTDVRVLEGSLAGVVGLGELVIDLVLGECGLIFRVSRSAGWSPAHPGVPEAEQLPPGLARTLACRPAGVCQATGGLGRAADGLGKSLAKAAGRLGKTLVKPVGRRDEN
jgi:hypothetical protein